MNDESVANKPRYFQVFVKPELHKRIKLACVQLDLSMIDLVAAAIEEYLLVADAVLKGKEIRILPPRSTETEEEKAEREAKFEAKVKENAEALMTLAKSNYKRMGRDLVITEEMKERAYADARRLLKERE